jgi:hypothetical protein
VKRQRIAALAGVTAMILPAVWVTSSVTTSGATPNQPSILHVGEIARQDIAPQPGSEPDTMVEPSVAVSPVNTQLAVAVAHDGRYPDGGAVDLGYAWTRNGGATWRHAPVPGLTKHSGGSYDRASDGIVQFAADGTAYLSSLLFDATTPRSAVAVSKSTDGGATWGAPVLVHASGNPNYSDDKNFLVIDNSPTSRHSGRLYQFWTPFIPTGSPQALRSSDDQGATWSKTSYVNPLTANTQDSQPMVMANGIIVDTYENFGPFKVHGDKPLSGGAQIPSQGASQGPPPVPRVEFDARRSTDGGLTWSGEAVVTNGVGNGPNDVRCCLPAANIDHVTGRMYAVWEGIGPRGTDPVELSSSDDGITWYSPVRVSQGDVAGVQQVNVTVVADHGKVYVSYGTRTQPNNNAGFVQQELSYSNDSGTTFSAPTAIGPVSALQWSAEAGGHFPGDYIGASVSQDRLYLVWCVSSKPANPAALFHQTVWTGVLQT